MHTRTLTHSLQLGAQCCRDRRPGSNRCCAFPAGGRLVPGTSSALVGPAFPARLPNLRSCGVPAPAPHPVWEAGRPGGCHAEGRREGAAEEVPESGGASRRGFRGDGGVSGQRCGASAVLLPLEGAGHSGCSCGAEDPGHPGARLLPSSTPPSPFPTPRLEQPVLPRLSHRGAHPGGQYDSTELVLLLRDPMGQVPLLPPAPALLPPQPGKPSATPGTCRTPPRRALPSVSSAFDLLLF